MNIWASMIQALRGDNAAENDAKALRILDGELRRAASDLAASKDELAELMALQIQAAKAVEAKQTNITEQETEALAALEQNNEQQALAIADSIVLLEADVEHHRNLCEQYQASVKSLQSTVQRAELNLKRLQQQVATIKATESVQRAQASIAERHGQAQFGAKTAQQSLALLKERQADKAARYSAEQQTDDEQRKDALRQQLAEAGIATGSSQANDVLARLKKQKSKE